MSNPDTPNSPEHLPPSSVEAEEAVLGAVLINADSLFKVASFLQASDFFIARHMWVWEALLSIHERGEAIDNITLIQELRQRGQLDDIGGPAYITYLINNCPTHIHAVTYGHIVERAAIRRRLLNLGGDIAQMALEENAEVEIIEERVLAETFKTIKRRKKGRGTSMQSIVSRYMDRVAYRYENKGKPNVSGVSTGFLDLDQKLDGGFEKSDLVYMAARPGVGKTVAMQNIVRNAVLSGLRVHVWSGEMPADGTFMDRMTANEIGIDSRLIKTGNLTEQQYDLYLEAMARMSRWPLSVDDTTGITVSSLSMDAYHIDREDELDLLVVDHIGLMRPSGNYRGNKNLEQGEISWSLKDIAMSLNIPVLVLCQLSREVEKRSNKVPVSDDLRDSGEHEQNADKILFLYRDELYNPNTDRVNQMDVVIAKQRSGVLDVSTLFFRKELQRLTNMKRATVNIEKLAYSGGKDGYND